MATARAQPLANVRASVSRMQRQGERLVTRLRRDAGIFVARSRGEFLKEVRDLERRLVRTLHAASAERVARLERRVTKLEDAITRKPPTGAEQTA
jgi:hypothetical protein